MKGLVVAGVHSGCGKTTITLGLMAAFKRRGVRVAPFKAGPDFIDPGHHTAITGIAGRNLDGWMLKKSTNLDIFRQHTGQADLAVVEGVMGLFDGYDGRSEAGSTAQLAKWLDLPVLLVVDARSMARSAGALVQGFENFDPDLKFTGVLFNKVGSAIHLDYLTQALEGNVKMPCLGGVGRNSDIEIPSRHLGLVTSDDHGLGDQMQDALADLVENCMDLDALLESLPWVPVDSPTPLEQKPAFVRIAVARDAAFCFYYPENIELLEQAGAQIIYFSPLFEPNLPDNIDGLYLGGGYPELHAATLTQNTGFRQAVSLACKNNMPIYAECGGFMTLCRTLEDLDGQHHDMVGCFGFTCRMSKRLRALGYREIRLNRDTILGPTGVTARGHEFHYSSLDDHGEKSVYDACDRTGGTRVVPGFEKNRTLGSYLHLHFKSNPDVPQHFVQACFQYQKERKNFCK
ncbi:cobyrinate a,c-diamide synthase [Desulfobacter hydrogenophilus]|uniref:Cobyrinate a,c-diamide synthase n=1 Tax=Desulfobacter hydrogenophilus TaxID=2291 RepID=A0A328FHW8_9BACT|nr:cobyrinate a,c-diamide synthase [Desulfobacter hydrogenophilus]NDY71251.1 cobyrinate a,c-diamide synthase [Desulfobacter hydrogenophilus]QBH15010.1 cobyrinate a,c-diamide synthase [Desulfobacter hydrogenophilus]RAM02743.1 cobyrinate a,c-diamide synthase [Desulfobacter hydrogenophilus]